jgi:hypothetical protein
VLVDRHIPTSILENLEHWEDARDTMPVEDSPVVDDLLDAYVEQLKNGLRRL